ncbi:MAG TPA: hypothetical protein VLX85_16055 [Stellaceae bacterium]|nr:hypothetical protein [Stellaceae bacterium]
MPRRGSAAATLLLLAFLGSGRAAATDAPEVEAITPLGILAWNDSVLLLTELNPCGVSANNDPNGEFSPFAGEILVSRDGGRSWDKRIEADTGCFEWFLATPTRLWIAGSHVQEAPGEAKILVATATAWDWVIIADGVITKIGVAENGRMVAWIEHPDNFLLDRWSRRVHASRDGGRSWSEASRRSKRPATRGLSLFRKIAARASTAPRVGRPSPVATSSGGPSGRMMTRSPSRSSTDPTR